MPAPQSNKPGARPRHELPGTPLMIGLVLSVILGIALFGFGLASFFGDAAKPFSTALVVSGFLAVVLSWYTYQLSRVAWSFLLSLDGTAAVVFLFGAAKVRDAWDTVLAVGLIPAVLFGVAAALVATSEEFRS
jgi:hypothetical protein